MLVDVAQTLAGLLGSAGVAVGIGVFAVRRARRGPRARESAANAGGSGGAVVVVRAVAAAWVAVRSTRPGRTAAEREHAERLVLALGAPELVKPAPLGPRSTVAPVVLIDDTASTATVDTRAAIEPNDS